MENLLKWCGNSFILKILFIFTKQETYQSSFFVRLISTPVKMLALGFQNSRVFCNLSCGQNWEKAALERSFTINIIKKLYPLMQGLIDYINHCIKGSLTMTYTMKVKKDLVDYPLIAISHIFLPFVLISTGLKAVFSSFTLYGLAVRLLLILVLGLMSFMNLSLKSLILGSISGEIFNKLVGVYQDYSEVQNHKREAFRGKRLYVSAGILLGIIYYFLPSTTFFKLVGLIFFSLVVYINPAIGISTVLLILPLTETSYSAAICGLTFASLILNYKETRLRMPTAFVPAAFFLAVAAIAAGFSLMRAESLKTFPLYIVYFMAFYCAAVIFRDIMKLKYAMPLMIISAVVVSLIGIYQYFFIKAPTAIAWVDVTQFPELSTRVYATMENPNVLAEYLSLIIPIILGLIWITRKPVIKLSLFIAASIITLCLILTFSRGAWVGFALAVMVFAVLKEPRLIFVFMIIALISPAFLPPVVMARIASIGSLEDSSNAFRISIWIAALRMIKDYWLTGVGLGLAAFARVYRDYMIAGTPAIHSHNLYLQIGLELGVAGLVAFLWLIETGFTKAVRNVLSNRKVSALLAGVIGALAGHLLHGLFDYVWFSPRIVMLFWLIFGIMAALLEDNEGQEGESA